MSIRDRNLDLSSTRIQDRLQVDIDLNLDYMQVIDCVQTSVQTSSRRDCSRYLMRYLSLPLSQNSFPSLCLPLSFFLSSSLYSSPFPVLSLQQFLFSSPSLALPLQLWLSSFVSLVLLFQLCYSSSVSQFSGNLYRKYEIKILEIVLNHKLLIIIFRQCFYLILVSSFFSYGFIEL